MLTHMRTCSEGLGRVHLFTSIAACCTASFREDSCMIMVMPVSGSSNASTLLSGIPFGKWHLRSQNMHFTVVPTTNPNSHAQIAMHC